MPRERSAVVALVALALVLLAGGALAHGNGTRVARASADTPVLEFELSPTWTLLEWTGPGGVYIEDALREGGLLETVVVVYHWDEFTRTWLAFFPSLGNVPGLKTLTAFEWGETYWIAVTEPVTWIIETPPPPATEQEAAESLAKLLRWFGTQPGDRRLDLSELLVDLWLLDASLASDVAMLAWVVDLRSQNEGLLRGLIEIAMTDIEAGRRVARSAWLADGLTNDEWSAFSALVDIASADPRLARVVTGTPWFAADWGEHAWRTLIDLEGLASRDPQLGRWVASLPWFTDGVAADESWMIFTLSNLASTDAELARWVARLPWFTDGATEDDVETLHRLNDIASADPEVAETVANLPWKGNLGAHLARSLGLLAIRGQETLGQVTGQPWFKDGLTREEAAFVVTLGGEPARNEQFVTKLLKGHYTQSKTVSLPLAGDVNIWVFQSTPFGSEEDFPTLIASYLRQIEGFMASRFPTNDVIVLIDDSQKDSGNTVLPIFLCTPRACTLSPMLESFTRKTDRS